MGYIHRGGLHDFGDKKTEYGIGLANRFAESVMQDYENDFIQWKIKTSKIKKDNKKIEEKYQQYLGLWNKRNLFYRIIYFYKKPKLNLIEISLPPRKPNFKP